MKKNFKVENGVVLDTVMSYWDLHNCYDYIGINIKKTRDTIVVKLFFEKLANFSDSDKNRSLALLQFNSVKTLIMSNSFLTTNSSTVEEIGYKDSGDYDYDWLLTENQANQCSDLVIRLEDDEIFRINSESAEIIEL